MHSAADGTIADAHLDSLNNRVKLDAPALHKGVDVSTTAMFVGYLVLSLVLLVLFFVFISYSESAYDAIERTYTRLSKRQWREGRQSVFIELIIFFAVLLFFSILLWQLAVQGAKSDAANEYGSDPVYPNPEDPLQPENADVPKERKKKMTIKDRIIAIVSIIAFVLFVALIAYTFSSEWAQDKIQDIRDHIGNRRNRERSESS